MQKKSGNSKSGSVALKPISASNDPDQLVSALVAHIEKEPDVMKEILYQLLSRLLGRELEQVVKVHDLEGNLYGFVVPPAERIRLRLLEDPELATELNRRSHDVATQPLENLLNSLQQNHT